MSILAIPTRDFGRSIGVHNVGLDVLCDWIEGSVLFGGDRLSKREFVDALLENNIYDSQDFASELIDNGWAELKSRQAAIGGASPYEFVNQRVALRDGSWEFYPAHAFCVILSLLKWYREWAKTLPKSYVAQGELFEMLVRHSVEAHFPQWQVSLTGWSSSNANKIDAVVSQVAACVGEPRISDITKWTSHTKNEAGLDLVCRRPFGDNRGGCPVFFFQCASGKNWEGKLHTPVMQLWTKLIEFTATGLPRKAFATPFSFVEEDFVRNCNLVDGLLMDRYRLLEAASKNANWLPDAAGKRIKKWITSRAASLPFL